MGPRVAHGRARTHAPGSGAGGVPARGAQAGGSGVCVDAGGDDGFRMGPSCGVRAGFSGDDGWAQVGVSGGVGCGAAFFSPDYMLLNKAMNV